jgi:hypothetical protein
MSEQYLIDGVPVEVVRSAGGLICDVTVVETGKTWHVIAAAFDAVAVPYVNWSDKKIVEESDGAPKI